MAFDITGTIHEIFDSQTISDTFRKRDFVLRCEDNGYTQYIKFQLLQDRIALLDPYSKGDEVRVFFHLSGRPYTNKEGKTHYYTNLTAWKFERQEAMAVDVAEQAEQVADDIGQGDVEELPF